MKLIPILLALSGVAVVVPSLDARPIQTARTNVVAGARANKYDFVLAMRDGSMSAWGNINTADFDSLRKHAKEDTLFVRKEGLIYAITDRAVIAQVKADIEPMEKLGRQQGELGRQQGLLGAEQESSARSKASTGARSVT